MRSRAKVLFAVVSCLALLALAGAAPAAQVYVPAQSLSGPGSEDGQLDKPRRAAIEQSTGNLFVADAGNGRVQVFEPDGDFLTSFGEAELDAPFGIAIYESAGQTEVYVSDPATNQILRYDSDEAAVPSFSVAPGFTSPAAGAGQLKVGDFAAALAVDPTNGDLWVADRGDDRAQRYSDTGAFELANDGSDSPGGAFTALLDIAADSNGRLYAVHARSGGEEEPNSFIENQPDGTPAKGQSHIDRFSASGAHQLTLAGLTRPATVAVDLATDEVAVSADQDAIDADLSPSLYVFDPTGAKLDDLRMGPGRQYTTVHGLVWRSSDQDLFSVNDYGYWRGSPLGSPSINRFELAEEPSSVIGPPSNVTSTSVDLAGTVNPGGHTTTARFEISSDGGSSWKGLDEITVCEASSPGDCTADEPVAFAATGLTPNLGYEVRLVATSQVGTGTVVESFATDKAPPLAEAGDATQRSDTTAVLTGTVNPYGEPATYYFEYGTSPGVYTTSVPPSEDADAGSGSDPLPVSQQIVGLAPATTYYFRIVAENASGATDGAESSFTTLPAGRKAPTAYRLTGTFANTGPLFGGAGTADGELNGPRRAAVEVSTGNLLVASQANSRVEVFQRSGDSATFLTKLGEDVLSAPFGIAIDQDTATSTSPTRD